MYKITIPQQQRMSHSLATADVTIVKEVHLTAGVFECHIKPHHQQAILTDTTMYIPQDNIKMNDEIPNTSTTTTITLSLPQDGNILD